MGTEGIRNAYATGRGRIIMRGVATSKTIPSASGDRMQINVTELPFQVNKSLLIERMAELVRQGRHHRHLRPARRIRPARYLDRRSS